LITRYRKLVSGIERSFFTGVTMVLPARACQAHLQSLSRFPLDHSSGILRWQEEDDMGKHDKANTPAATKAGPLSPEGPVAGQAAETRGGQAPDWDRARPGEPLPQLPEENDDPDAA
jgi:hypothetical protein